MCIMHFGRETLSEFSQYDTMAGAHMWLQIAGGDLLAATSKMHTDRHTMVQEITQRVMMLLTLSCELESIKQKRATEALLIVGMFSRRKPREVPFYTCAWWLISLSKSPSPCYMDNSVHPAFCTNMKTVLVERVDMTNFHLELEMPP